MPVPWYHANHGESDRLSHLVSSRRVEETAQHKKKERDSPFADKRSDNTDPKSLALWTSIMIESIYSTPRHFWKHRFIDKTDFLLMKLLFHGTGVYLEGRTFGPARWSHQDLIVVKEGSILLHTSKGSLRLETGDAVWIPPNLAFQGSIETDIGIIWVTHFQPPKESFRKFVKASEAGLGLFRGGSRSDLASCLMERIGSLYRGESTWAALASEYMTALLSELCRNTELCRNEKERWLHDLESWVRKHLSDGVCVLDMAQHADLSESHFRKIFRLHRGVSAGKFLHDLRLEKAKQLLHQSALSLKEISSEIGYSDSVAFHRAFATCYEMTPTQYRSRAEITV